MITKKKNEPASPQDNTGPNYPAAALQKVLIAGILILTFVGLAMSMIKMGKVMAKDLEELGI